MDLKKRARQLALHYGKNSEDYNDIEIICLEAAWGATKKLDSSLNPDSYVFKTMKNAALMYTREYSKVQILPLEPSIPAEFTEEDLVERIFLTQQIEKFIKHLVSPDKEIIQYILDGYTLVEIGKKLNLRPSNIAIRLYRGKNVWREMLGL